MTSRTSDNTDPTSARRTRHARRRDGFTLVEMLVVLGIILVLAAILLPVIARSWQAASRTAQANDLQAIATALEAYKQDWGDYPRVRLAPAPMIRVDYSIARSSNDQKWRPNPQTGAELLCFALMGMANATDAVPAPAGYRPRQDGAEGAGFRVRRAPGPDAALNTADDLLQGKIYPPYLSPDHFKVGAREDKAGPSTDFNLVLHFNILDRDGMPILYFPASPGKPNVTVPGAMPPNAPYVDAAYATSNAMDNSEGSRYDGDDNFVWFYTDPFTAMADNTHFTNGMNSQVALKRLRGMLGDLHNDPMAFPTTPTTTPDGVIQPTETAVDLPFLLWAAGPDEKFGPEGLTTGATLNVTDRGLLERCDDVTNFRP